MMTYHQLILKDEDETAPTVVDTMPPSSVPSVLISAQVKAGLDELKEERKPSKAIRIQELRRVSGSPVVMVAVFITSFCRQKPRGKSDWLQTERQRESW